MGKTSDRENTSLLREIEKCAEEDGEDKRPRGHIFAQDNGEVR